MFSQGGLIIPKSDSLYLFIMFPPSISDSGHQTRYSEPEMSHPVTVACPTAVRHFLGHHPRPAARPPLILPCHPSPGCTLGSIVLVLGPFFLRDWSIDREVCTPCLRRVALFLDRPVWAMCWQTHQGQMLVYGFWLVRSVCVSRHGGFQVLRILW